MKTFHDPEVFARVRRLPTYVFTITDRLRDEARARGWTSWISRWGTRTSERRRGSWTG